MRRTLAGLMLAAAHLAGAATSQYTLDFSDRSILVRARFPEAAAAGTTFDLHSWAGVSNFDRDIFRVAAVDLDGRALPVAQPATARWVIENHGAGFELRYMVVSPKDTFMGSGPGAWFHATLLKEWIAAWGHAFLLMPVDEALTARPVDVRVNSNEYGRWASTLPAGGRLDHLEDLADQLFLAGAFRVYEHNNPKVQYFFANRPGAAVKDEEVMTTVDGILRAQTRFLGKPAAETVLVAVVDGTASSTGGTHVRNSLVIYPDFSRELKAGNMATPRLAAHELFHLWNSGQVRPETSAPWSDGLYGWFKEGFTEYYSAATLFREGLLDAAGFATFVNQTIVDYVQNPESLRTTNRDLGSRHWLDHDHQRLPYIKGALIALLMDLQLRPAHSLDDYMRSVLAVKGSVYDEETLRRDFAALTDGEFWSRYVVTAAPLPFAEIFRAAGVPFEERETKLFDLGFLVDTPDLARNSKVTAVTSGSAGETAGIRVGDVLAGLSVWRDDPTKKAAFTIDRQGQKLEISYLPSRTAPVIHVLPDALKKLR